MICLHRSRAGGRWRVVQYKAMLQWRAEKGIDHILDKPYHVSHRPTLTTSAAVGCDTAS